MKKISSILDFMVLEDKTHDMRPSDSTTPSMPNPFAMAAAVMLATKDGKLTDQDRETMDKYHPQDWPRDIWEKLGFSPPTPKKPTE